jgi:hypothetical protein
MRMLGKDRNQMIRYRWVSVLGLTALLSACNFPIATDIYNQQWFQPNTGENRRRLFRSNAGSEAVLQQWSIFHQAA